MIALGAWTLRPPQRPSFLSMRRFSDYLTDRDGRAVEYVLVTALMAGLVLALPIQSLRNTVNAMFVDKTVSGENAVKALLK